MRRFHKKKKSQKRYTKGELNMLIDDLIHPLSNKHPEIMIVDLALHGLVEQNPKETTIKFIRYDLPTIIKRIYENIAR